MEVNLLARGVAAADAALAVQLFDNADEALPYFAPDPEGASCSGFRSPWKEYYSLRYRRYYYTHSASGKSSWEVPPPLQLAQWRLDSQLFSVPIPVAQTVFEVLHGACSACWDAPDALWSGMETLERLTGNIAKCGNAVEKYRTVKLSNPKVSSCLALPGARELLGLAGFAQPAGADALAFPVGCSDEQLAVIRLAHSRLLQLLEQKGFTGCAEPHDDTASGSSKHSGKPGFVYQRIIHECGACGRPINDGSDRVWTGKHDAPKGEYRYGCTQCADFNLCEFCYDKHAAGGSPLHDPAHSFSPFKPLESRREARRQTDGDDVDASNPWGKHGGGGGLGRARQRLKERYGL